MNAAGCASGLRSSPNRIYKERTPARMCSSPETGLSLGGGRYTAVKSAAGAGGRSCTERYQNIASRFGASLVGYWSGRFTFGGTMVRALSQRN
ncbi:hypothetical protein JGY85_04255 [Shigella sonnei]|nr:hypothetical protein [Shigella sonnei]